MSARAPDSFNVVLWDLACMPWLMAGDLSTESELALALPIYGNSHRAWLPAADEGKCGGLYGLQTFHTICANLEDVIEEFTGRLSAAAGVTSVPSQISENARLMDFAHHKGPVCFVTSAYGSERAELERFNASGYDCWVVTIDKSLSPRANVLFGGRQLALVIEGILERGTYNYRSDRHALMARKVAPPAKGGLADSRADATPTYGPARERRLQSGELMPINGCSLAELVFTLRQLRRIAHLVADPRTDVVALINAYVGTLSFRKVAQRMGAPTGIFEVEVRKGRDLVLPSSMMLTARGLPYDEALRVLRAGIGSLGIEWDPADYVTTGLEASNEGFVLKPVFGDIDECWDVVPIRGDVVFNASLYLRRERSLIFRKLVCLCDVAYYITLSGSKGQGDFVAGNEVGGLREPAQRAPRHLYSPRDLPLPPRPAAATPVGTNPMATMSRAEELAAPTAETTLLSLTAPLALCTRGVAHPPPVVIVQDKQHTHAPKKPSSHDAD